MFRLGGRSNSEELKKPAILHEQITPTHLRVGEPGAIAIPGKQLWRGSMVMLGGQPATRISILPDMKGIVAHFDKVPWVGSDKAEPVPMSVTVWTSEGSATTRPNVFVHSTIASSKAPSAVAVER